ncbi:hypothetical protein P8452_12977 [Trifolium repens]|nr:hypothetical protein P8452_12977 [Trifolium repens]
MSRTWIIYIKPEDPNSVHAGLLLALGLHGFLHCRLRGKADSNGVCAAYLEERLNMGLNVILSEELDHKKKDYKFGFGLTLEKLIRAGLDLYLHFFSQTSLASFLASFDLLDKRCSGVHRVYFMLL